MLMFRCGEVPVAPPLLADSCCCFQMSLDSKLHYYFVLFLLQMFYLRDIYYLLNVFLEVVPIVYLKAAFWDLRVKDGMILLKLLPLL